MVQVQYSPWLQGQIRQLNEFCGTFVAKLPLKIWDVKPWDAQEIHLCKKNDSQGKISHNPVIKILFIQD